MFVEANAKRVEAFFKSSNMPSASSTPSLRALHIDAVARLLAQFELVCGALVWIAFGQ